MRTTALPDASRRTSLPLEPGPGQSAAAVSRRWRLPRRQWKVARWPLTAVLCLCALGLILLVWVWQATPSTAGLNAWVRAQDGRHHAPYTVLAAVSPWMARALVATEDERFYVHHGVDVIGLLRASWDDLRAGSMVEGGSTLTAQLAKNAYLNDYDHTIPLKVEDLVLALKVEQRYSKDQILEMYLNLVYFGQGAYGIGAAANRYFGVAPARLDIAQAALLAGLVQAPGLYNPWCHPALAKARQLVVLNQMVAAHDISPAQALSAQRETFPFWVPTAPHPSDTYCA